MDDGKMLRKKSKVSDLVFAVRYDRAHMRVQCGGIADMVVGGRVSTREEWMQSLPREVRRNELRSCPTWAEWHVAHT